MGECFRNESVLHEVDIQRNALESESCNTVPALRRRVKGRFRISEDGNCSKPIASFEPQNGIIAAYTAKLRAPR